MLDIIKKLHPLEIKILPHISKGKTHNQLCDELQLSEIEVLRALQWLSNKELVSLKEEKEESIELDENGSEYKKKSLPEVTLYNTLSTDYQTKDDLIKKSKLSVPEFGVAIGLLKKQKAVETTQQGSDLVLKKKEGKEFVSKEKTFLEKTFPFDIETLSKEEQEVYKNLKKRPGMLKLSVTKTYFSTLTKKGESVSKEVQENPIELHDSLSSDLITSGKWKEKTFRHFDVTSPVPAITGGKRHFVKQAMRHVKQVWFDMGFEEMQGPMVQSAFWNLDALFIPQDHPARAMQDTFYVKDPATAALPKSVSEKVKAVHENGGETTSKGWGGTWSEAEAQKNMLRTHTTCLTAKTLASLKKEDLPAKFFSVNKVFRNEMLSWKHLFEFHQVEGIVIDPNATFQHLKGYLQEFYSKLGFEKIRMRPAYFPYTEPSVEIEVFHPEKKQWIELGGGGLCRPEVVKSLLGIDVPVLAWGQGLERGIMDFYGFKDIRDLYRNDIKKIKETKSWK